MLQRDYLKKMVNDFVREVSDPLESLLLRRDLMRGQDAEAAIAGLLDLDPATAMSLAPESLVTMMSLSGVADSVAGYVAYALERLAEGYEAAGQADVAAVRRAQAAAVAQSFGADTSTIPEEFVDLEHRIEANRGRD